MEQYIKTFDDQLNNTLSNFIRKPTIIRGVVHLLLVLYATRLAPSLPKPVLVLFENAYFKLFVFSLILWTAQFSPSTSILIALAFLVSTNYINQRPLFEFLDNVDTAAPTAPTKEVAVDSAVATVQSQSQNTPIVTGVAQQQETVVIQPSIVDTPQGPAVVNPTIVVAPAVVSSPEGQQVVIKPDVTVVEAPVQTQVPAPAPAPAPALAPAAQKVTVAEPAPTPEAQGSGCYPVRRYDMTKVSAFEQGEYSTL